MEHKVPRQCSWRGRVTGPAADGAAIGPWLPVAAISVSITGEGGFRHLPHLSLRPRASCGPHAARSEAQSLCPAHPKHPSTQAASNETPPWSLPRVLQWWERKTSLGASFALYSGPLSLARPGRAHHHSPRRADLAGQGRLGATRARDGTERPAPSGRPQATHAASRLRAVLISLVWRSTAVSAAVQRVHSRRPYLPTARAALSRITNSRPRRDEKISHEGTQPLIGRTPEAPHRLAIPF